MCSITIVSTKKKTQSKFSVFDNRFSDDNNSSLNDLNVLLNPTLLLSAMIEYGVQCLERIYSVVWQQYW